MPTIRRPVSSGTLPTKKRKNKKHSTYILYIIYEE